MVDSWSLTYSCTLIPITVEYKTRSRIIDVGGVNLDTATGVLSKNGKKATLHGNQIELLKFLISKFDEPVSVKDMYQFLYTNKKSNLPKPTVIKTYIHGIRKALSNLESSWSIKTLIHYNSYMLMSA